MTDLVYARLIGLKALSTTGNWCTATVERQGLRFQTRLFFAGMTHERGDVLEDALRSRSADLRIGAAYFEIGGITPNAHLCVPREGNFTSINAEIEERKACSTP